MESQTEDANDPVTLEALRKAKERSKRGRSNQSQGMSSTVTSLKRTIFSTATSVVEPCFLCDRDNHHYFECYAFKDLSDQDRYLKIREAKWCFNCGRLHMATECEDERSCQDKSCKITIKHTALIHGGFRKKQNQDSRKNSNRNNGNYNRVASNSVPMAVVPSVTSNNTVANNGDEMNDTTCTSCHH